MSTQEKKTEEKKFVMVNRKKRSYDGVRSGHILVVHSEAHVKYYKAEGFVLLWDDQAKKFLDQKAKAQDAKKRQVEAQKEANTQQKKEDETTVAEKTAEKSIKVQVDEGVVPKKKRK